MASNSDGVNIGLLRKLWPTNSSLDDIAGVMGVSKDAVRAAADGALLPMRRPGPKPKVKVNEKDFALAYRCGLTITALADRFSMSRSAVMRRIARLKLGGRSN